jgi:hypothetical protein
VLSSGFLFQRDIENLSGIYVGSYYSEVEVESALEFIYVLNDSDIVFPSAFTDNLLLYAGQDPSRLVGFRGRLKFGNISDQITLREKILSHYSGAEKLVYFNVARYQYEEEDMPVINVIKAFGERVDGDGFFYYIFELR